MHELSVLQISLITLPQTLMVKIKTISSSPEHNQLAHRYDLLHGYDDGGEDYC